MHASMALPYPLRDPTAVHLEGSCHITIGPASDDDEPHGASDSGRKGAEAVQDLVRLHMRRDGSGLGQRVQVRRSVGVGRARGPRRTAQEGADQSLIQPVAGAARVRLGKRPSGQEQGPNQEISGGIPVPGFQVQGPGIKVIQ